MASLDTRLGAWSIVRIIAHFCRLSGVGIETFFLYCFSSLRKGERNPFYPLVSDPYSRPEDHIPSSSIRFTNIVFSHCIYRFFSFCYRLSRDSTRNRHHGVLDSSYTTTTTSSSDPSSTLPSPGYKPSSEAPEPST